MGRVLRNGTAVECTETAHLRDTARRDPSPGQRFLHWTDGAGHRRRTHRPAQPRSRHRRWRPGRHMGAQRVRGGSEQDGTHAPAAATATTIRTTAARVCKMRITRDRWDERANRQAQGNSTHRTSASNADLEPDSDIGHRIPRDTADQVFQQRHVHAIQARCGQNLPARIPSAVRDLREQIRSRLLHDVRSTAQHVGDHESGLRQVWRAGHVRHDTPRPADIEGACSSRPLQRSQRRMSEAGDANVLQAPPQNPGPAHGASRRIREKEPSTVAASTRPDRGPARGSAKWIRRVRRDGGAARPQAVRPRRQQIGQ